jgi:hypothetical protein
MGRWSAAANVEVRICMARISGVVPRVDADAVEFGIAILRPRLKSPQAQIPNVCDVMGFAAGIFSESSRIRAGVPLNVPLADSPTHDADRSFGFRQCSGESNYDGGGGR